jgi:hypothetical protein
MRKSALFALSGLIFAGAAQAAPVKQTLAQALEGRVAGEPVSCINLRTIRGSRTIDGAILYDAGNVIYVNRPRAGAEDLNNWDTMVTRTPSTQLCNIDPVQMVHLPTGMYRGTIFLGDFVPYRRIR